MYVVPYILVLIVIVTYGIPYYVQYLLVTMVSYHTVSSTYVNNIYFIIHVPQQDRRMNITTYTMPYLDYLYLLCTYK